MNKFFIALYDFFESRRTLLYALLGVLVVAMASAALRLRFSENITGFFPCLLYTSPSPRDRG